jgi:hypothetical protein
MEKRLIVVARSKDNPDKVSSSAFAADSTGQSHLGQ